MASLTYAVEIDTKSATSSLNRLQAQIGRMGTGGKGFGALQQQVSGIGDSFRGLGKIAALGAATAGLASLSDTVTGIRNKLSAFSATQEEVNEKFNTLAGIAGRSRSDLSSVGDLYSKLTVASTALGLSQDQVAQVTESFTKSLMVGGATAAESASAILQFSQAMGSGVLRGEEFNAVFEASPSTMMELAKSMGVPIGKMRELAEDGKLTAKVITEALLKSADSIEAKFANTTPTIAQGLTNIRTAAATAFNELSQEDGPVKVMIDFANAILKSTNDVAGLTQSIKTLTNTVVALSIAYAAFALYTRGLPAVTLGMNALQAATELAVTKVVQLATAYKTFSSGKLTTGAFSGLISAFKSFDTATGKIMVFGKNLGLVGQIAARVGQIFFSLSAIVAFVVRLGLRMIPWAAAATLVATAIQGIYRALTGSNESLISFNDIWKKIVEVTRIAIGLLKLAGSYLMDQLRPYIDAVSGAWDNFVSKLSAPDWVNSIVSGIKTGMSALGDFYNYLKEVSGVAGEDRAAKASSDSEKAAALKKKKEEEEAAKALRDKHKNDLSKQEAEKVKRQADAFRDLKRAIIEVTSSFKEQTTTRLQDLQVQFDSIKMSEHDITLAAQKRDILKDQSNALKDLDDKQRQVTENDQLTDQARAQSLALIREQRVEIKNATVEQLDSAEKAAKAIEKENILLEKRNSLQDLKQMANTNEAALKAITDELQLVGLYGDKLNEVTAQLELQNSLREIEVTYQNTLLELEKQKVKLGAERYALAVETANAVKGEAIASATAQAAERKKVEAAKRDSERNDTTAAIGKRMEELARSVDPAVVAVQQLDSVFSNMGSAIDTFVSTGKFKFKDFARSVIQDLIAIQLKAAATKLLSSIVGSIFGIPMMAEGGSTTAGKPYIVGEEGPELFVPKSSGTVVPNGQTMNGNNPGAGAGPVNNTYITNNISALDAKSVAQLFAENRRTLFGAVEMAKKETPYRTA